MITPWLYTVTRPVRLRMARRRYHRNQAALRTELVDDIRAGLLDLMARDAELIACTVPDPDSPLEWFARAGILRAIAATERYAVLTEVGDSPRITGPTWHTAWEDLANAAADGDREFRVKRLRTMHAMCEDQRGIAVLLAVANTEEALMGTSERSS